MPCDRLVSIQTPAAGAARFAEDGRYLVICINRVHSINDWMFGFVNDK